MPSQLPLRSLLLIGVWVLLALISAGVGWLLVSRQLDRELLEAQTAGLKRAAAVAQGYSASVSRTLATIDLLTFQIKAAYESSGGKIVLRPGLGDARLAVSIFDSSGRPASETVAGLPNVSEEPFFVIQRSRPTAGIFHIGFAQSELVPGARVYPFSRSLVTPDGNFAGIVLVTVAQSFFSDDYGNLPLNHSGFLGIVGPEGLLRFARVGNRIFGSTLPDTWSISSAVAGESGTSRFKGYPDNRWRYFAWKRSGESGMTAVVGLDEDDVLEPYRRRKAEALADARLSTAALAALTLLAVAIHLSLARRTAQFASLVSTYRTATEGGLEGFFIASPIRDKQGTIEDFLIRDCNARGAEYLKHRPEQLKGRTVGQVFLGEAGALTLDMLRKATDSRGYEGEAELSRFGGLEGVWVHIKVARPDDDLAVTMRDITKSKEQLTELQRQSFEDGLTGLPNRHWLNSYLPRLLEHIEANKQRAAVLFIDLDGFKAVNDELGHDAGDEVLRHAGLRLRDAVRPHDHVVRIGGDEFLVLLERISSTREAAQVATRIVEAFKQDFPSSKGDASLGASVGVATFPADGKNAAELLQAADQAMYSVKASGKSGFRFYDKRLAGEARERLKLEKELRSALDQENQLTVYYQPRVSPITGNVQSMEALVRWKHPRLGLLSPGEFIQLAEDSRLIRKLGEVVAKKVCKQLVAWQNEIGRAVPVSINLSPSELQDGRCVESLRESIEKNGLSPALIELEITESVMTDMTDERISKSLDSIRALGCKLVLDDFGTGYSSLSQLEELRCDVLKVDRAFTRRLVRTAKGAAMFEAIVRMGHALEMQVVAEGVETREQLEELRRLGCDEVQGYYFSPPTSPEDSARFISEEFSV